MPTRPPKKLSTTASASAAATIGGKVMAERSGQGRASRPENFTTRAASHRLNRLVDSGEHAAAGGITSTRKSIDPLGVATRRAADDG